MRWLFAPITWLGRVCLWIVFWPLGLWRSIRHGSKKRERRIVDEIRKQQRPQG